MNKVLAIVLFVAVAAQAKVIPELVDRIALFPDMLKTLGLDKVSATSNRIVGGSVVEPHSVPWQVALSIDGSGLCGGSIIGPDSVLTAAHCCDGATSMVIIAGAHDRTITETTQVRIRSTVFTIHPNWASAVVRNDVCVIKLPTPLTYTPEIKPICLDKPSGQPGAVTLTPGATLTITGWGKTGDGLGGGVSNTLKTANLAYADNSVCTATYGSLVIVDSTLCCTGISGTSTCNGDSGGPLTEQQGQGKAVKQVGVVSFGSSAGCEKGAPVGFARVSSFYDWIAANAGLPNTDCP